MFQNLMNDETGVVICAELVLVLTIGVLAMIVGLSEVAVAVNTELNDISNAIGCMNQSFGVTGFGGFGFGGFGGGGFGGGGGFKMKSFTVGSTFIDFVDTCDWNSSCDIVGGVPLFNWGG